MINPFWNTSEHRLRAGWRILIQAVLFFSLFGLATGAVYFISGTADTTRAGNVLFMTASELAGLGAVILSVYLAGRFLDNRKISDFGLHFNLTWWLDLGFGLFLGALLMALIFLVELSAGWIKITGYFESGSEGFPLAIFGQAVLFLCVGIQEELFSRGYHFRNLMEGLNFSFAESKIGALLGYLISSTAFGLFHLGNPNTTWVSTINLIAAGLFLGLGVLLTDELAIPIGIHITWNFFQGNVFGFPVSGLATGASFINIQQAGPIFWTGGPFGPEAGMLGLSAMLLGCLMIILWVRKRR